MSVNSLNQDIYTVTRLNREVRVVLEDSFPSIWVQGEISNLAQPSSGHMYFSLKDRSSQVRCAMFKNRNQYLKFTPENGLAVILRAKISLYEGRGEFQLIVEAIEPDGIGALQFAFEQLKGKLNSEGLFDEENKKPLPVFPQSIAVITSPTGAAVRDILTVLKRRHPFAKVIIYPVAVQGSEAAQMIVQAVRTANSRKECEVIILSRGGGSLEDLWPFNEEKVARAIFNSSIPVVSGVGHEVDFTIADFVADFRAPTPSAAAEIVSPDQGQLMISIGLIRERLIKSIKYQISQHKIQVLQYIKGIIDPVKQIQNFSQDLDEFQLRIQRTILSSLELKRSYIQKFRAEINQFNPIFILRMHEEKCLHLEKQLKLAIAGKLKSTFEKIESVGKSLHTVSPLATLDRGYSIISRIDNGKILNDIENVKLGIDTKTEIINGIIYSKVIKVEKK